MLLFEQLHIEVAEVQTAASQMNPVYTVAEKQFTLVRPYVVKSVDFKSGPYSGGTDITVHGEVHRLTNKVKLTHIANSCCSRIRRLCASSEKSHTGLRDALEYRLGEIH